MKPLALALALLVAVVGAAAEPGMRLSPRAIRDEVRAVVATQLNALQEGDFAKAFGLCAASLRERLDERLFAALMRRGYAPLLRASEPDIGVVRDAQGELAQVTVAVSDRQKRSIVYLYRLVKEEEGWRIDGITLEQRPPRGDI